MKLIKSEIPTKTHRTKMSSILDEFIDSGEKCVIVEIEEGEYSGVFSACSSIKSAIKRFNMPQIKAFTTGGKLYLLNTLLVDKEGK